MPKRELNPENQAYLIEQAKALAPLRNRLSLILGPVAMIPGVFMMLVGFNVIHVATRSGHVPFLIFAAFGATVFLGGLGAFLQGLGLSPKSWLNKLVGTGVFIGMVSPFVWLLFFNDSIPESTKFFFRALFGIIIIFFLFVVFARFIPGVQVTGSKGPRAIERTNKGWEDE